MPEFTFEKLGVYQKAMQWVRSAEKISSLAKAKAHPALVDQLSRASSSIPLNIAEGNGRWHKSDKRKYFWIARGSVFEIIPILGILRMNGVIEENEHSIYREELASIGRMLTGLIKSVESMKSNLPGGDNS
jgi:four helix bundle protein